MAQTKDYIRLPGIKRKTGAGFAKLYLGKDHLLLVNSEFFSESYRRFYYKDIHSISVYKSASGLITNCFLIGIISLLLCLAGLGYSYWHWEPYLFMAPAIPLALFLIILLVNTAKGPTCKTKIITAAQTEELASLHHWWQTHRVLKKILPKIHEAQGQISPQDFIKHQQTT